MNAKIFYYTNKHKLIPPPEWEEISPKVKSYHLNIDKPTIIIKVKSMQSGYPRLYCWIRGFSQWGGMYLESGLSWDNKVPTVDWQIKCCNDNYTLKAWGLLFKQMEVMEKWILNAKK